MKRTMTRCSRTGGQPRPRKVGGACRIQVLAVHFLNNLHVELLAILLIINSLRGHMKVRLPIFSCNLSLAFLANRLCISILDDTRKARLFNFSLSAIPNCIGNYLYNCYLVEKM